MLSLLLILATFPTAKPFLTINREADESFHRMYDVAMDDSGTIYTVDRDEAAIHIFSAQGKYQGTIGRHGQGPGEFQRLVEVIHYAGVVWGVDVERQCLVRFKGREYVGATQFNHNPYSANVVGDKLVVAPINLGGPFHIVDAAGKIERTFKVADPSYAEAPSKTFSSLWRTLVTTPDGDGLILGLVYMDLVARIDLNGNLTRVWDMSDYLFTHSTSMGAKGTAPIFFSAFTFSQGPDGLTWMSASEEGSRRECNILYKVNVNEKQVMFREDMGEHIRRIRYFPKMGITAVGRGDHRIEFYRQSSKGNGEE